MTPIFLLFTPRSGSTLLQRMMATHPDIATVSEPWLLLPMLYTMKHDGVYAEYSHRMTTNALDDFVQALPDGWNTYRRRVRQFAEQLYADAAGENVRFFLDKSPRYGLALEQLMATFPDAKYIVLWRNPLAVIGSTIDTWADGTWKLQPHKVDLYTGLMNLVDTYRRHDELIHPVRYEQLVLEPRDTLSSVFRYLGLPDHPAATDGFAEIELPGERGDPVGVHAYQEVSREPLEKWQGTLNNPFRRMWCRRYLHIIGSERLAVMGYALDDLLEDLDDVPMTWRSLASDLGRSAVDTARSVFEVDMVRTKLSRFPRVHSMHRHR